MTTEVMKPIPTESVHDKLVLIKLYEQALSDLKKQLQSEVVLNSTTKVEWGKVTMSEASRAKIDGQRLYDMILEAGHDPRQYGDVSVKVSESTLEQLCSEGIIDPDIVSDIMSETTYTTLRVTPTKESKEYFHSMIGNQPFLLKLEN